MNRASARGLGSDFSGLLSQIGLYGLKSHSAQVEPGDVFVAMPGEKVCAFMAQAAQAGAGVIVARQADIDAFRAASPSQAARTVLCPVPAGLEMREALSMLAAGKFNTASLPFPVVGITGTNGKTTITYLFEHLYTCAGKRAGVMGTINYRWPGHQEPAPLTTPDCLTVHGSLAQMRDQGQVDAAFLEVSSHALTQKRVLGVNFKGAVFTNLTQDHLDYHQNMEDYFEAKASLFFPPYAGASQFAAINRDQAPGRKLLERLPNESRIISYGLEPAPKGDARRHLEAEILSCTAAGLELAMRFQGQSWQLQTPLIGAYNAENLLAVQAIALGFGFSPENFTCFKEFRGTPGRLERIENEQGLHVFVDYAHTPDALLNVQKELRKVGFKRLITVFGCGGNRDRGKRPLMGAAVARYADVAILTSDNPRCEEPLAIMHDVLPGLENCPQVIQEADRRKAIALALELAGPDDALLVAGQGHEDYQIIGTTKYPYSDQDVIRGILQCK